MNCSKHRHDGGAYRRYKTMVAPPHFGRNPPKHDGAEK